MEEWSIVAEAVDPEIQMKKKMIQSPLLPAHQNLQHQDSFLRRGYLESNFWVASSPIIIREMKRLITLIAFCLVNTLITAQNTEQKAEELYLQAYQNYRHSKFDSAITNFKKAAQLYDSLKSMQGYTFSQNGMAMSFLYVFEHDSARHCLQKALQKSDSSYYDGITYNNLSKVYNEEGDLQMERAYLLKALDAFTHSIGEENDMVALIMANIGNSYHHQGNYEKAIEYHEKALNLRKKVIKEPIHDSFAQSYWLLGVANRYIGNNHKALSLLNKALEIWSELYGQENEPVARLYFDMALCYRNLSDSGHELDLLKKSLTIRKTIYNTSNKHLAETYQMIGYHFFLAGDFEKALTNYSNALNAIGIEANDSELGSLEISNEDIQAKPILLDIMNKLGEVLLSKYEQSHSQQLLETSEHIYSIAVEIIQQQRGMLVSIEAKRALAKNRQPLFEGAIYSSLLLHDLTQKEEYITNAFEFSEKSKAYILHERLSESGAKQFGNIPEDMLAYEKKSSLKLALLQKRLLKAQQQGDSAKLSKIERAFSNQKLKYDSIIKSFEKEYPSYHQLKYSSKTLSIDDIRSNRLSKDHELIEYFIGDSIIYAFRLGKKDIAFKKIKKNFDLSHYVQSMREGIYGYHFTPKPERTDSLYKACIKLYIESASTLYQQLVAPVVTENVQNLIIIPDGEINFIPFSALLTHKPNKQALFKDYPYFIKKYSINYLYSASIDLKQKQEKKNSTPKLIAFAPNFNQKQNTYEDMDTYRRGNLGPLKYNKQEVTNVAGIMGGDLYTGHEASLNRFINEANGYDIIHIASHAKANNTTPELSFVAFNNDEAKDPNLYLADIYSMNLNAEMVVLSACETGFGKLYGSEGVASLAQGFAYAGAKSLLTTLWSVDDKATSNIISNFYKHLNNGTPKDLALHKAKINYLGSSITNSQLHPYYWSGIIMIGDAKPITSSSTLSTYLIIATVLSIALLTAIIIRRKNKKVSSD